MQTNMSLSITAFLILMLSSSFSLQVASSFLGEKKFNVLSCYCRGSQENHGRRTREKNVYQLLGGNNNQTGIEEQVQ